MMRSSGAGRSSPLLLGLAQVRESRVLRSTDNARTIRLSSPLGAKQRRCLLRVDKPLKRSLCESVFEILIPRTNRGANNEPDHSTCCARNDLDPDLRSHDFAGA